MPPASLPQGSASSSWTPPSAEPSADREPAGLQALLVDAVAVTGDDVGGLALVVADRLDQLGAAVDQPHPVVVAMGLRERAVRDEPVDGRAPGLLGVVVHPAAVRQEAEPVGHRAELRAERVGAAADVPADRP